jgi:hypothetical protein
VADWLEKAKQSYDMSTTYLDNNYRKKWDRSIRHFQSRHMAGSKYYKDSYKYRSKYFRPKTRSVVRSSEAMAMAALFSNMDVLNVEAVNKKDQAQIYNVQVAKQVLQVRLENDIPWFPTVMGAYQEAQVVGVVASYQAWEYEETREYVEGIGEVGVIKKDGPICDLLPVEFVRIHPAADWRDPINSSPFVIRLIPMYVADVKQRMDEENPKTGALKWKRYDDKDIAKALRNTNDETSDTRNYPREDPYDVPKEPALTDFDVVWVHENFCRKDGTDYVFYTLGTELLLTDPVPLSEVYLHGIRPIVMGCCIIEAHKVYPDSPVAIFSDLQKESNDVVNQRMDNVKLVLNKRYITRAGAEVDIRSLINNVPGSNTIAGDPVGDVRELEWRDVTSSAYAEQDRINLDFDEVAGSFSPSTIQSNRQLNETVGGLSMLRGSSNMVQEYSIRVFSETWVQPVLKQLIKLEQRYETDKRILAIAGERANALFRYDQSPELAELIDQDVFLRVNVGMGATDPINRINLILQGISAIQSASAINMPGFKLDEVAKEIFGRLGFPDGGRFFDWKEAEQVNMAIQQLQQQVQVLTQQLQGKQAEGQAKVVVEQMQQQGEDRRQIREFQHEFEMERISGPKRTDGNGGSR